MTVFSFLFVSLSVSFSSLPLLGYGNEGERSSLSPFASPSATPALNFLRAGERRRLVEFCSDISGRSPSLRQNALLAPLLLRRRGEARGALRQQQAHVRQVPLIRPARCEEGRRPLGRHRRRDRRRRPRVPPGKEDFESRFFVLRSFFSSPSFASLPLIPIRRAPSRNYLSTRRGGREREENEAAEGDKDRTRKTEGQSSRLRPPASSGSPLPPPNLDLFFLNPATSSCPLTKTKTKTKKQVLKERDFPYSKMKLLASARSAGRTYDWDGATITVEELTENSFGDVDIALFSAGGSISKKFAPLASAAGATVVDNSSAFRMTEGVPLVIPEINPEAMKGMKAGKGGIVANPNCSTIIALVAVTPLHKAATVKRMVVSTYQAASGAGQAAMGELERERERERILRVLEFFLSGRDSTRRKQGGKLTLLFLLLSLSLPLSPHVTPPPPPQTSSSSRPARPLKGRR